MYHEEIQARVEQHYQKVVDTYGRDRVLGVFLVGSQNYGLNEPGSDVDTKAIIFPSYEDIVMARKPVSTTLFLENGEQIAVKDVRLFMDCLLKSNVNFVETLFTDYGIVSKEWYSIWYDFVESKAEIVARHNPYAMAHCFLGTMSTRKLRAKDGKDLYIMARCYYMLLYYLKGTSFLSVLNRYNERGYLLDIKHGEWDAAMAQKLFDNAKKAIEVYDPPIEKIANGHISNWLHQIMTTYLRKELRTE